jgi:hypothetical protein
MLETHLPSTRSNPSAAPSRIAERSASPAEFAAIMASASKVSAKLTLFPICLDSPIASSSMRPAPV